MNQTNRLGRIQIILRDHEKRIASLERKSAPLIRQEEETWYRQDSTIAKLMALRQRGFFDTPRSLRAIITEFDMRDLRFKPSDLTLPLRKIVRKGFLRKTRHAADGQPSKSWLFVRDEPT